MNEYDFNRIIIIPGISGWMVRDRVIVMEENSYTFKVFSLNPLTKSQQALAVSKYLKKKEEILKKKTLDRLDRECYIELTPDELA